MYNLLVEIYCSLVVFRNFLMTLLAKRIDYKEIPIIINNRNRLTFVKQIIEAFQCRGYNNIIILDNNSTYPPLLEFYKNNNLNVIFLERNLGFDALEKIPLYNKVRKNFFVYTDPDILPVEECPNDFLKFFLDTLKKYPAVQKVGFSLKIDDLPDRYKQKEQVIAWEKKFYEKSIDDKLYLARIDTTFALHRPYATISTKGRYKMIRTGYPYVARHLPWYNDSDNLSEEEMFYTNNVEIGTHWSKGLEIRDKSIFRKLFPRESSAI